MNTYGNKNAAEAGTKAAQIQTKRQSANFSKVKSKFATPDGRIAELMDEAAAILGQSLYSHTLASPSVHRLEEALRVVFQDSAEFHRSRAKEAA